MERCVSLRVDQQQIKQQTAAEEEETCISIFPTFCILNTWTQLDIRIDEESSIVERGKENR